MKKGWIALILLFFALATGAAAAAEKPGAEKVGDPPYGQLAALVKKGLFKQARALLQKSRAQWPAQLWHANMGAVLIRLGDMEAAARHLEAALMAERRSAAIWSMLKGVRSYQARAAYQALFPKAAGPERVAITLLAPPKKAPPPAKSSTKTPVKTAAKQAQSAVKRPRPAVAKQAAAAATAQSPQAAHTTPAAAATQGTTPPELLRAALEHWRAAWSAQDVEAYVQAYAKDFHAAGTRDHAQWVSLRRARITRPHFIRITLRDVRWQPLSATRWRVRFRQQYVSNRFKDMVMKQLEWQLQPDGWKIVREEVLR